ncbi:MAG: selenocysteine-specific translation elongation factor [Dehalococcoidia bacterium]|nr:selenocysteine-specific translation elongation factor [Dehalococcoidia bacterium]
MYVIGTAGHIDHGKSLLVEALTGTDPDRLREEKARGMTIDLGFAWLTLPGGREVSIVDVPGHERFIKNMLAGAGGIDLALVVVAADDGVMPQTREHLAILDLLDVRRGVVALTKRDRVGDEWLALVAGEISEMLAPTTLAGAPVIACSALTREGLGELLAALDAAVDALPVRRDIGRPRLPIDRVFTIGGFGTVVTGTLVDGALAAGDEVEVTPGGLRGRIRGLQSHRAAIARAQPGMRTAVNIAGLPKEALRRGMVLAAPGTLRATAVVDVRVRGVGAAAGSRPARALPHNAHLTFHSGAAEANARLRLLDADELAPGAEAWAQIRLDTPLGVVRGDRFVLRTADDTVAGGVIADISARRHRRRDRAVIASLSAMLSPSTEERLIEAVARIPLRAARDLAGGLSLAEPDARDALDALAAAGVVRRLGDGDGVRYMLGTDAAALGRRAEEALAVFHREHHLRAGMPAEELRSRLGLDGAAFAAVVATWQGVRLRDGVAALASFAAAPTAEEQWLVEAYLASLNVGIASPPLPSPLRTWLAQSGEIVDTGDVVFEARAFAAMSEGVRAYVAGHGAISIAEARDLFGTNRKRAQALLEELDRRRLTRREGDAHVLP